MNKILFSLLMLFTMTNCSVSQKVVVDENNPHTIKVGPKFMGVDRLDNIIVVDTNNSVMLFDAKGVKKYEFADRRLGNIDYLDMTNPLNIAIFYRNIGIIRILDNTLSEIKTINLQSTGKYINAFPFCVSNDNNFWIYDGQLQKLLKLDESLKVIAESNLFNDLGLPDFIPEYMMEKQNKLIVSNAKQGFVIFDNFGQMLKRIIATDIKCFQFDGNKIMYLNSNSVKMLTTEVPSEFEIPQALTPQQTSELKQIILHKDRRYMSYKNGIDWIDRK
jgi:hypothetical protein